MEIKSPVDFGKVKAFPFYFIIVKVTSIYIELNIDYVVVVLQPLQLVIDYVVIVEHGCQWLAENQRTKPT